MKRTVIGMTRRKFLLSVMLMNTVTWFAGLSVFARLCGFQKSGMTIDEIKWCLLGIFSDLDSPRILGKRYLALYPQEKPGALLLAARIQSSQPGTSGAARRLLARERELDFRNGEIVMVDGWILSRTEAEICALTALL